MRRWLFSSTAGISSASVHVAPAASVGRVTCTPHGVTSASRAASRPSSSTVTVALRFVIPVTTASGNAADGAAVGVPVAGIEPVVAVGDEAEADRSGPVDALATSGDLSGVRPTLEHHTRSTPRTTRVACRDRKALLTKNQRKRWRVG